MELSSVEALGRQDEPLRGRRGGEVFGSSFPRPGAACELTVTTALQQKVGCPIIIIIASITAARVAGGLFRGRNRNVTDVVSSTKEGVVHDHSRCSSQFRSACKVHHLATPLNPRNAGRKIKIGGEGEASYLGFEDYVTEIPTLGGHLLQH